MPDPVADPNRPEAAGPPCDRVVAGRAVAAVAVVFASSGFLFATWASRIPQVRDLLGLTPAELGLAIMCVAVGSVLALPMSGLIVHHAGPGRVVATAAAVCALGATAVAVGVLVGLAVVAVGLFVMGFTFAVWDVAMNVEGAAVERRRGLPLMPRFHAAFSIGTVGGAVVGALMNAWGVPVTAHLIAVAVLCATATIVATRSFLADAAEPQSSGAGRALRRAWGERRTLVIGVLVMAISFAEGAGMDWIGVAAVDGYSASPAFASAAFAVFVTGVTTTRWFAPSALERFGRVACLRAGVLSGIVGVLAVVLGGGFAVLLVGALLWGAGIALGFPVAMSAAADEEEMAAPRVSVVSTIGYTAFLAGPALIGFVADRTDVVHALLLVLAGLGVAFLAASATRPLAAATAPAGERAPGAHAE